MSAVSSSWRRWLAVSALPLCGVLWAVWLLVPWAPMAFDTGATDGAYVIFSHIAFARGEPWGTSTLHTSGPLGFLRFPYFYRPTFETLLLGNAAVAAAVALLLYHLAGRGLATWARLPFVLGTTWILSLCDDAIWWVALLLSQLLIPELRRSRHWSLRPDAAWLAWPLLLDLAICALAANVKGSFLLMSAVLAAELAVLELRGRRAPVVSASFLVLVASVAGMAGMRSGDWGPYVRHIVESLLGYAESFSQAGSPGQGAALIGLVFVFVGFYALRLRHSPDCFGSLVRCSALAILVWMDAKGALVRQDWIHQLRAVSSLGVFFAVYGVARHREFGSRERLAYPLFLLAFSALFLSTSAEMPPRHVARITLERRAQTFDAFLRKGAIALDGQASRAHSEVVAEIGSSWPPLGTVGVFGTYQSLLLGHAGRQVMLPFIAPYEIWSPWTSRRERDFLMGPGAPDYLLYTSSPASAELALTLAARYREVERRPGYGVLRRRPVALRVKKRVVLDTSIDAGSRIAIPADVRGGPAVAEVGYVKTVVNVALSALYQSPEALLVLFDGSTAVAKIRMSSLLSGEGIVLSGAPGVWDGRPTAVQGRRFGPLLEERVEATEIGFEGRGLVGGAWSRYFEPRIHVRIYVPELD